MHSQSNFEIRPARVADVRTLAPETSESLAAAIAACMSRDPLARPELREPRRAARLPAALRRRAPLRDWGSAGDGDYATVC